MRTTLYHIFPKGKNTSSLCINTYKVILVSNYLFYTLHFLSFALFTLSLSHKHILIMNEKLKVSQYQENTDILYKHFALSLSFCFK